MAESNDIITSVQLSLASLTATVSKDRDASHDLSMQMMEWVLEGGDAHKLQQRLKAFMMASAGITQFALQHWSESSGQDEQWCLERTAQAFTLGLGETHGG